MKSPRKYLLIKSLPTSLNIDFNKQYSVGQVFERCTKTADNYTLTAFFIKLKDGQPFDIYHSETDCFKELP